MKHQPAAVQQRQGVALAKAAQTDGGDVAPGGVGAAAAEKGGVERHVAGGGQGAKQILCGNRAGCVDVFHADDGYWQRAGLLRPADLRAHHNHGFDLGVGVRIGRRICGPRRGVQQAGRSCGRRKCKCASTRDCLSFHRVPRGDGPRRNRRWSEKRPSGHMLAFTPPGK